MLQGQSHFIALCGLANRSLIFWGIHPRNGILFQPVGKRWCRPKKRGLTKPSKYIVWIYTLIQYICFILPKVTIQISGQISSRPHTSFGPLKGSWGCGNSPYFRKSRLVKYYNLARNILLGGAFKYDYFERCPTWLCFRWVAEQRTIK